MLKFIARIIPLLCLFILGKNASAQGVDYYSQFVLNPYLVNPAVAGFDGYTTLNIMSRAQWVGISGSPLTQVVSFQTRIRKNNFISRSNKVKKKSKSSSTSGRVGIGGYIYNDRVGIIDRTGFQMTYAYHIPLKTSQLSFALSLKAYQFKINQSKILVEDPTAYDALVEKAGKAIFTPDANFGVYYTSENYYLGFAAFDLAQASLKISSGATVDFIQTRNYNLMGGYRFPINSSFARKSDKLDIILEPYFLLRVSELGTIQNDIGCRVLFSELYWGGLSYRTPNIVVFMAGIKIDKFYIGYAFDANFSSIMRGTYGSHEFSIAYKFGESVRRYRWLKKTF